MNKKQCRRDGSVTAELTSSKRKDVDNQRIFTAWMAELVDARDLKSLGVIHRASSILAPGTKFRASAAFRLLGPCFFTPHTPLIRQRQSGVLTPLIMKSIKPNSTILNMLVGTVIVQFYNQTVIPLILGFLLCSISALVLMLWIESESPYCQTVKPLARHRQIESAIHSPGCIVL